MQRSFLYVANWKMQLTHQQSIAFVRDHYDSLMRLAQDQTIILCPSFDVLASVKAAVREMPITLGAQNVSAHELGAYTGQVPAVSLKQVGCAYCIVGHSEGRSYNHESDYDVAQKVERLAEMKIVPIVCVGESAEQRADGDIISIVRAQLEPIIDVVRQKSIKEICIAYEPVWAIGTGETPSKEDIAAVINELRAFLAKEIATTEVRLLYGGSVSPESVAELKGLEGLNGFLIGGASIDFQKLQKIVS